MTALAMYRHKTAFKRVLHAQHGCPSSLGPVVVADQTKAAMRVADLGSGSLQVIVKVIIIILGLRRTAAAHHRPRNINFNPTP